MTDISAEFFSGFMNGLSVFSPGNPHIPTSACHMAFEAGRKASFDFERQQIKSARTSRGYSVRADLVGGDRAIFAIDYDRRRVTLERAE